MRVLVKLIHFIYAFSDLWLCWARLVGARVQIACATVLERYPRLTPAKTPLELKMHALSDLVNAERSYLTKAEVEREKNAKRKPKEVNAQYAESRHILQCVGNSVMRIDSLVDVLVHEM
jgi:hypothetical protein